MFRSTLLIITTTAVALGCGKNDGPLDDGGSTSEGTDSTGSDETTDSGSASATQSASDSSDPTTASMTTGDSTSAGTESTTTGTATGQGSSSGETGSLECAADELECDGGCVDPLTAQFFCGAVADCEGENVGTVCSASATCEAGECIETCINCSFESGSFSGWVVSDLSNPYYPLEVGPAGLNGGPEFFLSAPTDGEYAAVHGFDGNGATSQTGDAIIVAQDLSLTDAAAADLLFDYRLAWDTTFGATKPRLFHVRIEQAGGGLPLALELVHTVPTGNLTPDTGDLVGTVDLSAFAGQDIRVSFVFTVPEDFTGPAFAQLDNIRFEYQ